ncbi:MAG: Aspartate oxidase [Evtepia sp.]|jgi:L-aspartate oxidase|nr:Aspartate oxidase [Evtepia sp.]
MNYDCDVAIVGTGAAGLFCALNLPNRLRIQIITKKGADESDSFLAQGGICVLRGEEDYEAFFEDTLRAGHYENNRQSVDLMIRFSNCVIRDLSRRGVRFETEEDGSFCYTREGAHSKPRIMYHKDITGKEITATLLSQVKALPNVTIREHITMLDLIAQDNRCGGLVVSDAAGTVSLIKAPVVVLCCGGLGGLYENTTNFRHISGDALAIALKHGVAVQNMDYIQVHPTTLYSTIPGRRFLISESVRGEGAYLYDKNLNRFTDELLPRDKLTQEIFKQMEKDGTPHVWEDMRPIGKETILNHFPNIYKHCLEMGIDVLEDLIPVVPAQHYFMGGIQVNLASQSSMLGLYACGETSCNGVHGQNRLASNSLLEALIFAQRAAEDITFGQSHVGGCSTDHLDLDTYRDQDQLFSEYRTLVLNEIERMRQAHE